MNVSPTAIALVDDMLDRGHLPALTENVSEICALTSKTDTRSADLAAIIMRDCGMTSNVLVTANSAMYCPKTPIKTVSAAVTFLGFEKVRGLVLGLEIFKQSVKNARDQNLMKLYANSYFAGAFSQALARNANYADPEEIFVAGLLFQLPRVALANAFPARYKRLEELMSEDGKDLDAACNTVFDCVYTDVCFALAQAYRIPGKVAMILKGEDTDDDNMVGLVRQAVTVAEMLFSTGKGEEAVRKAENEIRELLKTDDFSVADFIRSACADDPNINRFFNIAAEDVDIMVRILEWGKASPAKVVAGLQFVSGLDEETKQDPELLIGHFLTELMMCQRRGEDVNHVLMLALEAVYRCVAEAHVFIAFSSQNNHMLVGRFYAGENTVIKAEDFRIPFKRKKSPIILTMDLQEPCLWGSRDEALGLPSFTTKKLKLKHAYFVPLCLAGRSFGMLFAGRSSSRIIEDCEQVWIEQIAEQVSRAFALQAKQAKQFVAKTL